MQIDFHHGVTYIIARKAGLDHNDAQIVAHCAQYVDDATENGIIDFQDGAMYNRISSAHKMLDYRNFEELANHQVWIPFHFLPGNNLKPADQDSQAGFIDKIICRPNSYVAQDMINACILSKDKTNYSLHRLGISMHVYADTWAHQGFAGINHVVNDVCEVTDESGQTDDKWTEKLGDYFRGIWDKAASNFVSDTLPLGHGAVLNYPDLPYLKWSYKIRADKSPIKRDNPTDYVEAADCMCKAIKRYIAGDPNAEVQGLTQEEQQQLKHYFESIVDESGQTRHQKWLTLINDNTFDLGSHRVGYISKGPGSWKDTALGNKVGNTYRYSPEFLMSNWKRFHDALIAHRFELIHNILPRYNICAA